MKKYVSLKLIVFSFLLVATSISYSAPVIQGGSGSDSTVAGVGNEASGFQSSAFGYRNAADAGYSFAAGNGNRAGDTSSAVGYVMMPLEDGVLLLGLIMKLVVKRVLLLDVKI
ncbi:hypothetical protein [Fusobacterium sp.]|uniref:hypothetical protein n=1 Tax=Fusobacterium sp. TaxID=68766 RepID=UPI0039C347A4